MSEKPRISVLMPVYNAGTFVAKAIQSVLRQKFTDFELVILNDASTDNSAQVMSSFNDPRIRIITNERNLGITATLNKGIALCQADLIARMDADDIMLSERLQRQWDYMLAHPEIEVLATKILFVNTSDEITGDWRTDTEAVSEEEIRRTMASTNCIAHPTVMIRKRAFERFQYRENQKGAEDWDLWMRILNSGARIAKLDEVLLHYRVHDSSIMASSKKEETLEVRLLRARRKFLIHEFFHLKWSSFFFFVMWSQCKTLVKHMGVNFLIPFARNTKRCLTYSPIKLLKQKSALNKELSSWKGKHLFVFTYVHEGGAEQVHSDVLRALELRDALILITGFSANDLFLDRFAKTAKVLVIPELANHPFTKASTLKRVSDTLNTFTDAVVFSANNEWFFDLIPLLQKKTKLFYLIHAFQFQPGANVLHKKWLRYFSRIEKYIFISQKSREEFEKFCFHNQIVLEEKEKLIFISNAVEAFVEPKSSPLNNVIFVGRNSAEKRVDIYLKIAARIKQTHPNIQFSVVGMSQNSQTTGVTFLGLVSEPKRMSEIYSSNQLLILTSSREGFPMVIMEAMAHGLAVVATPVGDIPGRLKKSAVMITSAIDEAIVIEEVCNAMLQWLHNPKQLDDIRKLNYQFASKEFVWGKFRDAYRSLFNL